MTCRGIVAVWMVVGLAAGLPGHASAQSPLALKGTLDGEAVEVPPATLKPETTLEISPPPPLETLPLRRADAVGDAFAATGVSLGSLRLYPSITAGTVYSSNINSSPSQPRAGVGLRLKPSLRLESDWVRHALSIGLDGDLVRYGGSSRFDTSNLDISERFRLDVRRHTTAEINSGYVLDAAGGDDAAEHSLTGGVALTQDFGPMSARLSAAANLRLFEDLRLGDGSIEDNGDRDYFEPSLALRTTYNEYGALKPYIEASLAPRFHSRDADRNGINRDSTGYALTTGLQIDTGPIWSGDLGFTYIHRDYDAASLGSAGAFGLTGNLTWSPGDLTRIVMSTGTILDEATLADLPATTTWTAGVNLTHGLRDNVDLLAGVSVEIEDTGPAFDKTYDGSIGVAWKFNPVLAWTAAYDLKWFDAGAAGGDYLEHRLTTGLTLSR